MAGFQGFGYRSPEEIIAETQAGFQRALQSGDPNQMRAAIMQQAAFNIGGTPELRKARKTERVLQRAHQEAPDTGDEISDQIAFYEKAQKSAVDAELPEIAMQATEKLSQLRLMQEERSRLKNAEGRAQEKAQREKAAFDLQMEVDRVAKRHLTTGLLVNPDTLEVVDRGDLTDPEALARMNKLKAEDPTLVFRTEGEYLELTEAEKDRRARVSKGMRGWEGRSSLYKEFYADMQNNDAFANTADDFVDLLTSPEAAQLFAAGGDLRGGMEKVGYHGRSLFGSGHQELLEEDFQKYGNSESLKDRGISWNALSSDKKALIMELGYALATTRESGRLTDQDVERAIVSLGVDNPDPRAIAWIFGRSLKRTRDNWASRLRNSGLKDLDAVRGDHKVTLDALDSTLNRLSDVYAIDFENKSTFDDLVNPREGFARDRNESGVVVREVGQAGRGRRRVVD